MSNKLYSDNVSDYLVEGANTKGYVKNSSKGFGDGAASSPVKNYNSGPSTRGSSEGWFEGKKSDVGTAVKR